MPLRGGRLAYQMLLYTGQRKSEVRALMWDDVHLDQAQPYALFRESTTKDKDRRAVPLRTEVVAELKAMRPKPDQTYILTKPIFWVRWPTYDLLRGDFKRSGIQRVDSRRPCISILSVRLGRRWACVTASISESLKRFLATPTRI